MKKILLSLSLVACSACALFHTAAKPAAYGTELAACEAQSKSWSEYEPCCVDVAHRYGRDPSFCMRPVDGGNQ